MGAPNAASAGVTGGAALQHLTVTQQGPIVTGVLTAVNADAAAAINGFTGPNVSAQEASDVMRGVMQSLGPTELFTFLEGATLRLRFEGASVTGSIEGKGRSVLNTSSDVACECRITARLVK